MTPMILSRYRPSEAVLSAYNAAASARGFPTYSPDGRRMVASKVELRTILREGGLPKAAAERVAAAGWAALDPKAAAAEAAIRIRAATERLKS